MATNLREIGLIARGLDAISNIEFRDIQLTKGQYVYLARIVEHPGLIQEELSEVILVDRTTVARAITKLVAGGLLEKRPVAGNQKNKALFATDAGLVAYDVVKRENDYSEERALAGFTAAERLMLNELLQKMRANVAEDWALVKSGQKRVY
jgi:DNA-binding MarR family transcriptional regulator